MKATLLFVIICFFIGNSNAFPVAPLKYLDTHTESITCANKYGWCSKSASGSGSALHVNSAPKPNMGNIDSILSNFQNFLKSKDKGTSASNVYDGPIQDALDVLYLAAETKREDPEKVLDALESLEKLTREKVKAEGEIASSELLQNLKGDWRLVFTTGTKDTQKRLGAKINYFPLKAVQSFDPSTNPFAIQNGIYIGDFALIKFFGDFEFNLKSRKLEFDFDKIAVLGFEINLGKGKAAELGSASGLGSKNNENLIKNNKKPFFNWISADDKIATARGGGGGLALWKRVDSNGSNVSTDNNVSRTQQSSVLMSASAVRVEATIDENFDGDTITVKSGKQIRYDEEAGRFFEE